MLHAELRTSKDKYIPAYIKFERGQEFRNNNGKFSIEITKTEVDFSIPLKVANTVSAVAIPSAVKSDNTHLYVIDVFTKEESCWRIHRRYREFDKLQHDLKKESGISLPQGLPPKTLFRASFKVVQERKQKLTTFLNALVVHPVLKSSKTLNFFLTKDAKCLRRETGTWKTLKPEYYQLISHSSSEEEDDDVYDNSHYPQYEKKDVFSGGAEEYLDQHSDSEHKDEQQSEYDHRSSGPALPPRSPGELRISNPRTPANTKEPSSSPNYPNEGTASPSYSRSVIENPGRFSTAGNTPSYDNVPSSLQIREEEDLSIPNRIMNSSDANALTPNNSVISRGHLSKMSDVSDISRDIFDNLSLSRAVSDQKSPDGSAIPFQEDPLDSMNQNPLSLNDPKSNTSMVSNNSMMDPDVRVESEPPDNSLKIPLPQGDNALTLTPQNSRAASSTRQTAPNIGHGNTRNKNNLNAMVASKLAYDGSENQSQSSLASLDNTPSTSSVGESGHSTLQQNILNKPSHNLILVLLRNASD
eukprot:UN06272